MKIMNLSPELVEHAKKEVAIEQYYCKSETVTAQHILFNEFVEKTKWKSLPKIIFYLLLNEAYGQPCLKDDKGLLGYAISLNSPSDQVEG